MPPTLGPALRLGLSALRAEGWLVALGLAVAGLRRFCGFPAAAFASAVLVEAAVAGARASPLSPAAPLAGVAAAIGSPRFLAIAAGLWLAGALCAAALRVAFVSGAAPALAAAMAGGRWGPAGFAGSCAAGFPRVAATAALGFVAELSAGLFALALAGGAIRLLTAGTAPAGAPALALATALALTLAVAVPWTIGVAVDAAVARSAVTADRPGAAFAAVARRLGARPGSFLLGSLLFGLAGLLVTGSIEGVREVISAAFRGAGAAALAGPGLMLSAGALLAAAVLDLAWLATVSVLACGESR